MPEDADHEDAELALRIIFEALLLLIDYLEQPLWFVIYEQDKSYHILHKDYGTKLLQSGKPSTCHCEGSEAIFALGFRFLRDCFVVYDSSQ